MSAFRLGDLAIPHFKDTEAAEAWGEQQESSALPKLHSLYKTLERIALTTADLQKKHDYACDAQLIREAAEAIPRA